MLTKNRTTNEQIFKSARRTKNNLIVYNTEDPQHTINQIISWLPSGEKQPMIIKWTNISGFRSLNGGNKNRIPVLATKANMTAIESQTIEEASIELVQRLSDDFPGIISDLKKLGSPFQENVGLPERGVCIIENAGQYFEEGYDKRWEYIQIIQDLVKILKNNYRTIILIGAEIKVPIELAQQAIVLSDEPIPETEIEKILTTMITSNNLTMPTPQEVSKIVPALRGLIPHRIEKHISLALDPKLKPVVNVDLLWQMKEEVINSVKGLHVSRTTETFDDIGGLEDIKSFITKLFNGKRPPKVIALLSEVEKVFASASISGDNTGTSSDFLSTTLTSFDNYKWKGMIFDGSAGTGKDMVIKAIANTFGVLGLVIDLNGAKESLLGVAGSNIRKLYSMLYALGGEDVFFVASSNASEQLPSELIRRFTFGRRFFPMPTKEAALDILGKQMRAFQLSKQAIPNISGYSPADIRNLCNLADALSIPLVEAAKEITPAAIVEAARIRSRGEWAQEHKIKSASTGLPYVIPGSETKESKDVSHEKSIGVRPIEFEQNI